MNAYRAMHLTPGHYYHVITHLNYFDNSSPPTVTLKTQPDVFTAGPVILFGFTGSTFFFLNSPQVIQLSSSTLEAPAMCSFCSERVVVSIVGSLV